jgi:hypothetical protein
MQLQAQTCCEAWGVLGRRRQGSTAALRVSAPHPEHTAFSGMMHRHCSKRRPWQAALALPQLVSQLEPLVLASALPVARVCLISSVGAYVARQVRAPPSNIARQHMIAVPHSMGVL